MSRDAGMVDRTKKDGKGRNPCLSDMGREPEAMGGGGWN